jgi:hypothetical protein
LEGINNYTIKLTKNNVGDEREVLSKTFEEFNKWNLKKQILFMI